MMLSIVGLMWSFYFTSIHPSNGVERTRNVYDIPGNEEKYQIICICGLCSLLDCCSLSKHYFGNTIELHHTSIESTFISYFSFIHFYFVFIFVFYFFFSIYVCAADSNRSSLMPLSLLQLEKKNK